MVNHVAPHSSTAAVPQQAPEENVEKFEDSIQDEARRRYAGIVDKLDESVGAIVKALETKGLLDNSILVFVSDNGGPAAGYDRNQASNWPLRGVS